MKISEITTRKHFNNRYGRFLAVESDRIHSKKYRSCILYLVYCISVNTEIHLSSLGSRALCLSRPGHSTDRCDSVHYDRAGIFSPGERDCFSTVSSPIQPGQSVRLVLQQLPGLHGAAVHHHQGPSHAHRRLRLLGAEHVPQHPLQKNHQPDCLL